MAKACHEQPLACAEDQTHQTQHHKCNVHSQTSKEKSEVFNLTENWFQFQWKMSTSAGKPQNDVCISSSELKGPLGCAAPIHVDLDPRRKNALQSNGRAVLKCTVLLSVHRTHAAQTLQHRCEIWQVHHFCRLPTTQKASVET